MTLAADEISRSDNSSLWSTLLSPRARIYWVTALVMLSVRVALQDQVWLGSTTLHTVMEAMATVLALTVGALALVRFYSHKNNTLLFIGMGFIGAGLLDGYHTLVTSEFFFEYLPSSLPSLSPWSWIASRLFLAAMMWLSWLAWKREQRLGDDGRISEMSIYFWSSMLLIASFTFFAFVPLPIAYYPAFAFHRPEEFVPVIFFALALAGYLHKGAWRTDPFEHWLVLSLIVGILAQALFMSFSAQLFDSMFDMAHTLKKLTYILVLIGLLFSMFSLFRQAENSAEQLVKARDVAETATLAKSQFLANMSHEIRSPMTAILGFADILVARAEDENAPAEQIDAARTIKRNGEYLVTIINDILDLSKIEAGRMGVNLTQCSPWQIARDVVLLQRANADLKKLPVTIMCTGSIPATIRTDDTRLRQILLNLVGNAVKFTEHGSVRLEVSHVDDGALSRMRFDVVDSGIGMTDDEQSGLFQAFTQVDTSTTRGYGGSGLGLIISKRFAELLGGDVSIVDSAPGTGTRIRVEIETGPLDGVHMIKAPDARVVSGSQAKKRPADATVQMLNGMRLLLAEDGHDNQRLFSIILQNSDATITVCENGKLAVDEALRAWDQGRPFDVILMDMQMPVMDGYEATRALRDKNYTSPIIALTAHAMSDDRDRCIRIGCDDFAAKPVGRQKLQDLILANVRRHRMQLDREKNDLPDEPSLIGCRILLAEDDPANQVLAMEMLKKPGADITAVANGESALNAALVASSNGNPFDVILMDIQMPKLGGEEATRTLRDKGYTNTIIALTAHAIEGDRKKYLEFGFDDYATKPINRIQLIQTICQHWDGAETASI